MLHYRDRREKIHIITLDRVLATDVFERLHEYPQTQSVELVQPGRGESTITVEDIREMVLDTTTSRVLIIDVRRQTKPRLQQAYSDIVRFNRPDFHRYCHSVLIEDGPFNLFTPAKRMESLYRFLSDLRVDYSPAVFFGNPFLHYSHAEIQEMNLYNDNALPEKVSARLTGKMYRTGIRASNAEMKLLNLRRHTVCPQWNYTIEAHQRD